MVTVTVADIVISGATVVTDSGGWDAPERRVERGFDFSSFVDSEPIEVTITAWADDAMVAQLRSLRERTEPVEASIGDLALSAAKLTDLEVENSAEVDSHQEVDLTIEEVREATVESAEISIETEAGAMGSAAEDQESSTALPEDNDGGEVEDETGGIASTLSGVRSSLSGVLN